MYLSIAFLVHSQHAPLGRFQLEHIATEKKQPKTPTLKLFFQNMDCKMRIARCTYRMCSKRLI